MQNKLWIGFLILSITFLLPGLSLPVLTLTATVDKAEMMNLAINSLFAPEDSNSLAAQLAKSMLQQIHMQGTVQVFDKTRSILGTMEDLISSGNVFIGLLIGLFAVIIPLSKLLLLAGAALLRHSERKHRLRKTSALISKWSMSDVFVMAIMVSYLAANATKSNADAVQLGAELGPGFYFFAAYCLFSILSSQLLEKQYKNAHQST